MKEKYDFEIKAGGCGYDLLDLSFNETTKNALSKYVQKPNLRILDIGCGSGVMTEWLCQSSGDGSHVTAIDRSVEQIEAAKSRLQGINNVSFHVLSAYDLSELGQSYDLIYCRFVLHHLHSPIKTINIFYNALNKGGIYFGEEGLIHQAFAYPPTFAWQGYLPKQKPPAQEQDGVERDGDFGMKLFYYTRKAGFEVLDCKLVQPLLWRKEEKKHILANELPYKKTALANGMIEDEWNKKFKELERCVEDDDQIIGFYGSAQIVASK
jgi:SAM-dependent methyltransferase